MKIRFTAIVLLLALCTLMLASCSIFGDKKEDDKGGTLAYEVSGDNPNECIITGRGSCMDQDIVIPEKIDGKTVVGIADRAFSSGRSLSTVKPFPKPRKSAYDSETTTDESFSGTVTEGSAGASGDSTGPTYVISDGVAIEGIYVNDTAKILAITSVTMPESVKEIGDEAFYGCGELAVIDMGGEVTSIGKDAFTGTAYYNDPENWEGGTVLYLRSYLLNVSTDYQGTFTVKDGTTIIADNAFSNCTYITSVNLASSVTTVGNYAFYGCSALTNVGGISGLKYSAVAGNAFEGCVSYYYVAGGQGGSVIIGGNTNSGNKEKEDGIYDVINEAIFVSAQNNALDHCTIAILSEDHKITYERDPAAFHYIYAPNDGSINRELYGVYDENGASIVMKIDGKYYWTTAAEPEFANPIADLDYSMLKLDSETNLYSCFIGGDNDAGMVLGFDNGHLAFLSYTDKSGKSYEIRITDYDMTKPAEFPYGNIEQSGIADENGNIR